MMILGYLDAARRLGAPPTWLTPLVSPAPWNALWESTAVSAALIGVLFGVNREWPVLASIISLACIVELHLLAVWRYRWIEMKALQRMTRAGWKKAFHG